MVVQSIRQCKIEIFALTPGLYRSLFEKKNFCGQHKECKQFIYHKSLFEWVLCIHDISVCDILWRAIKAQSTTRKAGMNITYSIQINIYICF